MKFDAGKPRLKSDTKAALDKAVAALLTARGLKVVIVAHPDAGGVELAKKRADAVKFYLNEGGIAVANISDVARCAEPRNRARWSSSALASPVSDHHRGPRAVLAHDPLQRARSMGVLHRLLDVPDVRLEALAPKQQLRAATVKRLRHEPDAARARQ